jgi:hypothetical protein
MIWGAYYITLFKISLFFIKINTPKLKNSFSASKLIELTQEIRQKRNFYCMKQLAIFCAAALAVLSGCISYEYDGKVSGTPTSTVEICTDASKLNMNEYSLLGTASASGDSVNYSRYELFEKLSGEAKKCGRD